jgi:hypothetical protein
MPKNGNKHGVVEDLFIGSRRQPPALTLGKPGSTGMRRTALKCSAYAALAVFLTSCINAHAQTIPPQFQDAYTTVNADINSFSAIINANWSGTPSPVRFSSQLQTGNSDLTTSLLVPNYYQTTVLGELNSLQALGMTAITFHVNFPALYQPFYANSADYQAYLTFYTTLVNEIHSRGLKVIIENMTAVAYPGTNGGSFTSYYQTLDWPTYMTQRAQLAASIVQQLQPDYLVLEAEPDTEATGTGQSNVNTVSGATQMVQGMIGAIQANGTNNTQLIAGCDTWNPISLQFIQSFLALPLPLIDMHIYPVNMGNLPTALSAMQMIQAAGKQPTMSEAWDYKESDSDYLAHPPYTTIYARDVFSFWESTDINFLQTMANFANYGNFAFIAPFWSNYYDAYLDYNVVGGEPDATLITSETTAASQERSLGVFTPTGTAWENMIIPTPDTTPPVVPPPPSLGAVSQTSSVINVNPTTDNVGVAGYYVYRNTALVGTLNSPLIFYDSKLKPNTKYSYTVAAFDASHNLSPKSAPLVVTTFATPDTTPPSVPTGITPTPLADTQIRLNWTASVDNVAVTGYEIYRGTTMSTITAIGTSPTNFYLDTTGAPAKTYYYQIDAYDATNNHSARSSIVTSATLPDTTPPTIPGNVSVVTQTGPKAIVSWSASTDDWAVANYQIYRGTSITNMTLIGSVLTTVPLTFTDTHITSGKMYYYSVAAFDVARNMSKMSTPVLITAP